MRKRGLYCCPESPRQDIVKLLFQPGSAIILVFSPEAPVLNSKENPFIWSVKYTGWGKFAILD